MSSELLNAIIQGCPTQCHMIKIISMHITGGRCLLLYSGLEFLYPTAQQEFPAYLLCQTVHTTYIQPAPSEIVTRLTEPNSVQ